MNQDTRMPRAITATAGLPGREANRSHQNPAGRNPALSSLCVSGLVVLLTSSPAPGGEGHGFTGLLAHPLHYEVLAGDGGIEPVAADETGFIRLQEGSCVEISGPARVEEAPGGGIMDILSGTVQVCGPRDLRMGRPDPAPKAE